LKAKIVIEKFENRENSYFKRGGHFPVMQAVQALAKGI
jgi:hypothetical protein